MAIGDNVVALNGVMPRDVIEWQQLVDEGEVELEIERGGIEMTVQVTKAPGQPLGVEVDSALFDQVRTCDNHCDFCFIYQLPKGLRKTLYLKDDDYRLSFLYGNFTTLTRFTEADLERVITERLSPLYVSIHATDPDIRTDMLKNRRGAMSLRWLRAILDEGIEVHGQVVVCPGWNDGDVLENTLAGVLDEYPELDTVGIVPLGVSQFAPEGRLRPHTLAEAQRVVDIVEEWQQIFLDLTGRRRIFAADEYYLLAERPFPQPESYEGFPMHEDGIGMARTFEAEFNGETESATGVQSGFFAWVEGAPAQGYRAQRTNPSPGATGGGHGAENTLGDQSMGADAMAPANPAPDTNFSRDVIVGTAATSSSEAGAAVRVSLSARKPAADAPIGILTGPLGARVLGPIIEGLDRSDVRVIPVPNDFFGGNVGVTGLMVGEDIARVLSAEPVGHRYLLPDVCLSNGTFLDGTSPDDLPRSVEVISTDGIALRNALEFQAIESQALGTPLHASTGEAT